MIFPAPPAACFRSITSCSCLAMPLSRSKAERGAVARFFYGRAVRNWTKFGSYLIYMIR